MKLNDLVNELKTFSVSLIPFSVLYLNKFKFLKNAYESKGLFKKSILPFGSPPSDAKVIFYSIFNSLISFVEVGVFGVYFWGVVETGTLNYTKWNDIKYEQYVEDSIRRSDFEKKVLDKAFNYLDANLDGLVSKEEFKQAVEKAGFHSSTGRFNNYDELNWRFNLGEEHVDVPYKLWGKSK